MTTTLYLDGKKAYIRRYGIASPKVNKAEFETLIKNDDTLEVIVNKDNAKKFAIRISRLGYILENKIDYDMFTFKLTYKLL